MSGKIPYYKTNNLLWRWKLCEGAEGCEIVFNESLSMDTVPPPLPAPKAPPAPKPPKPGPTEKMVNGPGGVSQYLGHWSKNGVIVVPYNVVAAALNEPALYTQYPVAVGRAQVAGNVYYPVQNSDFRRWAKKHQRGGDFIVYSDKRWVPVFPPIRVAL